MPTLTSSRSLVTSTLASSLVLVLGCNNSSSANDTVFGDEGDGASDVGDSQGEDAEGTGEGEGNEDIGESQGSDSAEDSADSLDDDDGGSGPKFDTLATPDSGGDGCGSDDNDATLTGTVFAPNGTIPVVGALVYTSSSAPESIPDQVYCAECIELECGVDFTETDINGNFSLPTNSGSDRYLVVQKGQFMRVAQLDIATGETQLPDEQVELPGEWDPDNGLYIPKIAVADGSYDRIEDALGKFGLGDTSISDYEERTIAGTESFDLYNNGRDPSYDGFTSQGTMGSLISDPDRLADYHIIFVPCSSDTYGDALTAQQIQNIRDWVEAGGRWYVADWSNEFMSNVFPEYQTFYSDAYGNDLSSYDSLADVLDDGLLAWLEALPGALKDINPLNVGSHPTLYDLPQVGTVDNWSGIQYPLPEVLVDDGEGGQVNVGHKAWLEGPGGGSISSSDTLPLTVTGQYGCGKVQFTSYHAAEFENYVGLSPQELVLLYTILEIGVCQDPLPPPQG
ncbi:hypothetical protein G6O69_10865 [Pseudenhygromyxa sp. WMMC2535]|uniref:hypothetical protein n=1 Tax=Pseudenhygromyxa sp. WMMC2535 TaxID=2712867 RepID=UPI0015957224|nr:hypothetical protein [Pseudenhygromyxa sp. WMMC2535]NVB38333.1 hypothetical protein [Pseudenhygromyxa sp. WMMC2535]